VAGQLAEICSAVAEELGGPPTLGELLEVFGWAYPQNSEHLQDSLAVPVTFTAKFRPGRTPAASPQESRMSELNDAVFVMASDCLAALARELADQVGRPATALELSNGLLQALQTAEPNLADTVATDLKTLTISVTKSARKTKVGDIIAIPAKNGGYHVASVLAKNSFGTALGLYQGKLARPKAAFARHPVPMRYPVYTDEHLIAQGQWRIVGHDEKLPSLFPAEPEIYHRNEPTIPNPLIGKFGAAETAAGRLRQLDEKEARDVGLLDGTYHQVLLGEELQNRLDENTVFPGQQPKA
jgi:hypothetical protein